MLIGSRRCYSLAYTHEYWEHKVQGKRDRGCKRLKGYRTGIIGIEGRYNAREEFPREIHSGIAVFGG